MIIDTRIVEPSYFRLAGLVPNIGKSLGKDQILAILKKLTYFIIEAYPLNLKRLITLFLSLKIERMK